MASQVSAAEERGLWRTACRVGGCVCRCRSQLLRQLKAEQALQSRERRQRLRITAECRVGGCLRRWQLGGGEWRGRPVLVQRQGGSGRGGGLAGWVGGWVGACVVVVGSCYGADEWRGRRKAARVATMSEGLESRTPAVRM